MKKGQKLRYEWVVWKAQNGDPDDPDTIDYFDSYADAFECARHNDVIRDNDAIEQGWTDIDPVLYLELRKQLWDEPEGDGVLQEAFVLFSDSALPECFDDGTRIPQWCHREVAEFHAADKFEHSQTR